MEFHKQTQKELKRTFGNKANDKDSTLNNFRFIT